MKTQLPKHVAIIMDGNRRWAKRRGLPVMEGHRRAADEVIEPLIKRCIEGGIPYLTLWAFSTENWRRSPAEVKGLIDIFRKGIKRDLKRFDEMGVRLNFIGEIGRFPKDIVNGVLKLMESSKKNKVLTLTIAINYGGRDEILRGIRRILMTENRRQKTDDRKQKTAITEEEFEKYLDTAGMPDPDLLIRTGGEARLSGFMSWQIAYCELYFTDVLFPDFSEEEFDKAIKWYGERERKFGK
jgi:undecaprenyl diphosphate synthase